MGLVILLGARGVEKADENGRTVHKSAIHCVHGMLRTLVRSINHVQSRKKASVCVRARRSIDRRSGRGRGAAHDRQQSSGTLSSIKHKTPRPSPLPG